MIIIMRLINTRNKNNRQYYKNIEEVENAD